MSLADPENAMAFPFDVDRPLPENAQKDIEALAKNSAKLLGIMQEFSGRVPNSTPVPIFAAIASSLSTNYSEVSRIFSAIENLSEMTRWIDGGVDGVTPLLRKRLSAERAGEVEANEDNIKRLLQDYSKDHPVAISVKAEKLSYLHENLYQDGEIITDARPIFDSSGTKVIQFVVTHSLIVHTYSFGSGHKRIHFSMDAADVTRLKDACDRATTKAKSLKEALEETWAVTVLHERGGDA